MRTLCEHYANIMRTWFEHYANNMRTLCEQYANNMRTFYGNYANNMWLVCEQYANIRRTLCEHYANNMGTVCDHYANNMRTICVYHANIMRTLCEYLSYLSICQSVFNLWVIPQSVPNFWKNSKSLPQSLRNLHPTLNLYLNLYEISTSKISNITYHISNIKYMYPLSCILCPVSWCTHVCTAVYITVSLYIDDVLMSANSIHSLHHSIICQTTILESAQVLMMSWTSIHIKLDYQKLSDISVSAIQFALILRKNFATMFDRLITWKLRFNPKLETKFKKRIHPKPPRWLKTNINFKRLYWCICITSYLFSHQVGLQYTPNWTLRIFFSKFLHQVGFQDISSWTKTKIKKKQNCNL